MDLLGLLAAVTALAAGYALGARRAGSERVANAHTRRDLEEAVDAARGEAERLRELLTSTGSAVSDAVLHLDAGNRVTWATSAARAGFDIDPATRPTLMMAARSVELQDLVDGAPLDQPEAATLRIRDRTYHAVIVKHAAGDAVIALRDDTELERLARARRDLVANVSHDIRTPLTSIGLLADTLLTPAHDGLERREAVVAQIRGQLRTLQALADGMVELNQLESGRALLRLQPEGLAALAQAAVDGIAPQLDDSQVRAVVDVAPDIRVLVDGPHIVRVITNLLDNARRFSPPGGSITIRCQPAAEPDRLEVAVSDEGSGIPPGDLGRIFERFYRGDRARTRPSAGLGLAIARHVVAGHGGRIWAENNRGRGATVRFTLPVAGVAAGSSSSGRGESLVV